jgi:signal transduction histidine kinase/CheY-like chemotaxis protein
MPELHKIAFDGEPDLVQVRRVVRRLAQLLQFEQRDEVKITAAVSELTRAAGAVPGGGVEVVFAIDGEPAEPRFTIEVMGPGLAPEKRARGSIAAESIVAAEKLLERVVDVGAPTALRFCKPLAERAVPATSERVAAIRAEITRVDPRRADGYREELTRQTHELAEALLEIEERKQELATLNAELSDTNRGVVALYAELDDRASQLRRADELKTRFFSQMSHEFRTPLNSILALSNILLEEADGPLLSEQRRQVGLIRDGVTDLLDLVGDLLDLAKMEAGKTQVHVAAFGVGTLFGALRAMMRPLLPASTVSLEFGATSALPALVGDEGKVMQILRNFLSNAVKFTERGQITVTARFVRVGESVGGGTTETDSVLFAVMDTGIGIAREYQAAIFEEFRQVENRLQRKSRGSGLGLPLCRRLAGLLGGRVWVESEPGHGATFYLLLPCVYGAASARGAVAGDARPLLLMIDERADRRSALVALFLDSAFLPVEATPGEVTSATLAALQPTAAVLDTATADPTLLEALRGAAVPVMSVAGADFSAPPGRERLLADTYHTVLRAKLRSVLIVDDDEAYRTILKKHFAPFCELVHATGDVAAASAALSGGGVDCLVLDLIMPELDGLTLLQRIRADAATAELPIVMCSSKSLSAEEQALLRRLRAPFLAKDALGTSQVARALLNARRLAAVFTLDVEGSAA